MTSPRSKPSRIPAFVRESAAYGWLSDAWEALRETADEALVVARRSAQRSNEEQWRRYETKVGNRRADERKRQVIEGEALPAKPAVAEPALVAEPAPAEMGEPAEDAWELPASPVVPDDE